jgi:hypothetical protein
MLYFGKCLVKTFSNNACNKANCYFLFGFDSIQSFWQTSSHVPYGPMMVQSSGSNLCDVWCSSVSKTMTFSLATLMAEFTIGTHKSPKSRELSSFEGLLYVIQYFMQPPKSLSCDQPVGFALSIEAVVTPVDMWFLKCNLGNINMVTNGISNNNHCDIYPSIT